LTTPEARHYRNTLGTFATGVAIVTIITPDVNGVDRVMGMTINSFTSVSITPKIVSWSLDLKSERFVLFAGAKRFGINILSVDQHNLAERFFRGDAMLREGETLSHKDEALRLEACLSWLSCQQYQTQTVGDHLVIYGEVEAFDVPFDTGLGLTYFRGRYGQTLSLSV
jgi:flavin reductase (DIM6/NTAB) family NADH-FMN oxidoreductase RutF